MKVHFVCTGNVYRSRLAEAYFNSKQLPNATATSSGILAELDYDLHGPIFWAAMLLIQEFHIPHYMSPMPTQTTLDLLHSADVIIFMKGNHHEFSKRELGFVKENFEIWNIPDLDDLPGFNTFTHEDIIHASAQTFTLIREKVDNLVERLQK